jgi:hypothetical protein
MSENKHIQYNTYSEDKWILFGEEYILFIKHSIQEKCLIN